MIKANELRIGNWVFQENRHVQLNEDDLEVLFAARNYEDYNPIQLTPEILEKCGFKMDSGADFTHTDSGLKLFSGHHEFNYWGSTHNAKDFDTSIKYLHQLQNLYFALTGEELKVTL